MSADKSSVPGGESVTFTDQVEGVAGGYVGRSADASIAGRVETVVSHDLAAVEATWQRLAAGGLHSPGQNIDLTRLWIAAFEIAPKDRFFVTVNLDGQPLALLALQRRRRQGTRALTWFPGSHVGSNAPLADLTRLRGLSPEQRREVWAQMRAAITGADLIYLRAVPAMVDGADVFAELGTSVVADTLYRAEFASWDEADRTQRSKTRRKHDRQQGEKLDALGAVEFEEVLRGEDAQAILCTMFRQRAARFASQGIADPFADPQVRRFYDWSVLPNSPLDVRLHVLRLNGDVVAVRYNIVEGDAYYCLISSMSDDAAIQVGSPGKQCLLRVMQTVFEGGARAFDMGAGLTDEKRHWCNVQVPVRQHYLPLTAWGRMVCSTHRGWQKLRARLKTNRAFVARCREGVKALARLKGGPAA